MPKPEKFRAVEVLKARLELAKSLVITDYRGLTVAEMTELRRRLRQENVDFKISKNRLTKIALREAGMNTMDDYLKGTTAIAFGMKDPITPAKVLTRYAKDNDKLKIIAGLMDNNVLDQSAIIELSKLPSREMLLSRLVGSLASPVQKLAYGLNQTVARVAYIFDAVARQKAEQGGAAS